ncbi:MAG: cytoplasmic protein [bacterium]
MRYILIIASVILLASPLFGNSHKVENLFGWHTSSGVQLRKFGDNDTHPVYNGEAENRQPHGMGIMTFPDGRKYVGEYKNGKRHGLGTISYVKGERKGEKYIGEFKEGKMWSIRKYNVDGKYVGEYKNGLVWNGIVYENGNVIGRWVNGLKQ